MNEHELIIFAQWHMRCTILRYVSRESCILSVRILADILGRLGIPAIPLATGALALNEAALTKHKAGEEFADDDEAFGHRCIHEGISDDKWYKGHVVLVAGGRYLCDPSADQFAHPEKDLIVLPLTLDLVDGPGLPPEFTLGAFLDGDTTVGAALPHGGAISYQAHQDDFSYIDCMDWEDSAPGDRLFDAVVETTMGILDLYADEPMPDLPQLPAGISAKDRNIKAWELKAIKDLGYTEDEMKEKNEREDERNANRRQQQSGIADTDTSMLRSTRRAGPGQVPVRGPKP